MNYLNKTFFTDNGRSWGLCIIWFVVGVLTCNILWKSVTGLF
jgi:hypothetical protein